MTSADANPTHALRRVLGMGFGLAMAFGTTVGVGILRLPGTVAAALGDKTEIMLMWAAGGVYALLGAFAVAELAAMYPKSGGFRVYLRPAFGPGAGFVAGWCDWLSNAATLPYVAMTAAAFLGALWPTAGAYPKATALVMIAVFTVLHWMGVRIASTITATISISVGLMLMTIVIACFIAEPAANTQVSQPSLTIASMAMPFAAMNAFRAVLVSYNGWYSPIYMAEESTNPTRTLPRALIGGALLVTVLYLVINLAFLRVLPMNILATSELPAADAARAVLPSGGGTLVTIIALLTILSLINNVLLMGSRVLFAIGRDGFFTQKAAEVSTTGTPRVALVITSIAGAALILSGTFEEIVALVAVLVLLYNSAAFVAVFVLRFRQPETPRPYKAFGYPVSTAIVLAGSLTFLVLAIMQDPRSGVIAAVFVAACAPVYVWIARGSRLTPARAENP